MIDRLKITNFKAFASADIPLASYTLLTGLNSSGKSTVLQALALLRQSEEALLLHHREGGGFLLNGELVELGTGQDVLHEDYVATSGSDPHIEISLQVEFGDFSWRVSYGREDDLLPMDMMSPEAHYGGPETEEYPSLFRPGFQYLKADRVSPAVIYPRSNEIAVRRGFLGSRGEYTVNYLRHFQDEPVRDQRLLHPQASSVRLLDQVEAWMQEICPGVNLQATEIEGTDLVRLSFRFGTAGLSSTNRYRPTNVGFGLSYVLPIVVACLTARPDGMVLLENPEAHLHPRGQTAIATLTCAAAAAGAQLIVESHSDHVLNGVRLAVKRGLLSPGQVLLHYFQRDSVGIGVITPTLGSDGMLSDWPAGFFDEWDRSLDQLLD